MQPDQPPVCAQCGHSPLDHDPSGECQVVGRCTCAVRPRPPRKPAISEKDLTDRENTASCAGFLFFVLATAAPLLLIWSWRWAVTLAVVSVPFLLLWRRLVRLSSETRRSRRLREMIPR